MRQARNYELSDKEISMLLTSQINQAVDKAFEGIAEEAVKPDVVKKLKSELRRIVVEGEMIYPI